VTLCRRCIHDRDVHQHLRRGTDCALCVCTKYTPDLTPRGILRRLDQAAGLTLAIVIARLPERLTRRINL
jgi:hypothetical protein